MFSPLKVASKLDSFYSLIITLPILAVIGIAAMQYHNGALSTEEFGKQTVSNIGQALERATSNYRPVVETAGQGIATGITKATGCISQSSRAIHLTAGVKSCGFKIGSLTSNSSRSSGLSSGKRPIYF